VRYVVTAGYTKLGSQMIDMTNYLEQVLISKNFVITYEIRCTRFIKKINTCPFSKGQMIKNLS